MTATHLPDLMHRSSLFYRKLIFLLFDPHIKLYTRKDRKTFAESLKMDQSSQQEMICVKDFEEFAKNRLKEPEREFYRNGVCDEYTLKDNISAFHRYIIRPKFLRRDVSKRDLKTSFFGQELTMPICVAPTALQRMAHPDGEIATAKACEKLGCLYIMSTMSTTSIEEIAKAAPNAVKWFQLYLYKDRRVSEQHVKRAEKNGFKAIVLTADLPVLGLRRGEERTQFRIPSHLKLANFEEEDSTRRTFDVSDASNPHLTWNDVTWLKSICRLPILVKGILTREDATTALKYGVDGIIVSNHGARQLDSSPATIDALPEIVEVVKKRVPVLMDGGLRRGSDVFKAVALGADGVCVGRPVLWGLIHAGQEGVERLLNILKKEFSDCMALSGCRELREIDKSFVKRIETLSKL